MSVSKEEKYLSGVKKGIKRECTYPNLSFVWIVTLQYLNVQATQMVTFGSVEQRRAVMADYGHHKLEKTLEGVL